MNDEPGPVTIRWMLTDDSCAAYEFRLAYNLGCNPCHIFPIVAWNDWKAGKSLREGMENQLQRRRELFDPTCLLEKDPHDTRPNRYAVHGGQRVPIKYGTKSQDARTGEVSPIMESAMEEPMS